MAHDGGGSGDGGGCLAALGITAVVVIGLYLAATVNMGGVRQVDETGQTTQVLTWRGWRPAGEVSAPTGAAWPSPLPAAIPAAPPVVIRPAATPPPAPLGPTWEPAPTWPAASWASEGGPAQSAGVQSSMPAPSLAWQALGWALCGLVGIGGTAGLGLLVYRQVHLTRAQAGAIRAGNMGNMVSAPPPPPPSAKDDKGPRVSGEVHAGRPADGAPVSVSEYLAQGT